MHEITILMSGILVSEVAAAAKLAVFHPKRDS